MTNMRKSSPIDRRESRWDHWAVASAWAACSRRVCSISPSRLEETQRQQEWWEICSPRDEGMTRTCLGWCSFPPPLPGKICMFTSTQSPDWAVFVLTTTTTTTTDRQTNYFTPGACTQGNDVYFQVTNLLHTLQLQHRPQTNFICNTQ